MRVIGKYDKAKELEGGGSLCFHKGREMKEMHGGYDEGMAKVRTKILLGRAAIEITGILFLFYSNLLMGEFTGHSRTGKTLAFALNDIFTKENLLIGVVASTVGFLVFEWFRKRLEEVK